MIFVNRKKYFYYLTVDYTEKVKAELQKLDNLNDVKKVPYFFQHKDFEYLIIDFIENYLPKEIYEVFGFKIKSKVLITRQGSLLVIFSVVLTSYYAISKYKNFIESAQLLSNHIKWSVKKFLDSKFGKVLCADLKTQQSNNGSSNSIKSEYLGIIGVIIGAIISGIFILVTQNISYNEQRKIASQQIRLAERQELKPFIIEYTEIIASYADIISDPKLNEEKVTNYSSRSFKVVIKLSALNNSNLGDKASNLNTLAFNHFLKKINGTYTEKDMDDYISKAVEWTKLANKELTKY